VKTIVRNGVLLGVLVEIWTVVMIATGWHKDPMLLNLFFLVIPLQVTILVMALRDTAAAGDVYGKQVLNGIGISLVAGGIIFLGSVFVTTVLFPNYFSELRTLGSEMLAKTGLSAAEIESRILANPGLYDPVANGVRGFVGTTVTGAVVTAITAFFVRKR
jgi:hypothetical protein